jgi:hypothetical protein
MALIVVVQALLLICFLICEAFAARLLPTYDNWNFGWGGLFFYALYLLVGFLAGNGPRLL